MTANTTPAKALVVLAETDRWGKAMSLSGTEVWTKISSKDTAGAWSAFESIVPKDLAVPLHFHHAEEEWFWVLSGTFLFEVGEEQFRISTGTSLLAPRKIPHRWKNVTIGSEGRLLILAQSAGRVERFFNALALLTPDQMNNFALLNTMFTDSGMQVCGPSFDASVK